MQEATAVETGRVARWIDERGIGFLSTAGSSRDLFFSAAVARERPGQRVQFAPGDAVEFTRGADDSGRPRATWVRRIEEVGNE